MINIENLSENWTQTETFTKGQVIISEGESTNGKMYIIQKGSVAVYKNYRKYGEICIADLPTGAIFGEMELLLNMERTDSIVATEDVTTLVIERADAFEFLKNRPEVTFSLIH
ncbi:MAG: cyclic nucleotide-binding domain-containing protein, partial [Defluviitaleaceae bacterium]|nr:cyclic nucleotide-binding domain-containing protein [Defluviitaleaceae bacterium]